MRPDGRRVGLHFLPITIVVFLHWTVDEIADSARPMEARVRCHAGAETPMARAALADGLHVVLRPARLTN